MRDSLKRAFTGANLGIYLIMVVMIFSYYFNLYDMSSRKELYFVFIAITIIGCIMSTFINELLKQKEKIESLENKLKYNK